MKFQLINHEYFEELCERQKQCIPEEGLVELTSPHTEIVYYDKEKKILAKAAYDTNSGNIVPLESVGFSLDDLHATSSIIICGFKGEGLTQGFDTRLGSGKIAVTSFLNCLELILTTPVVEIGQTHGDSCSRYFPARNYEFEKEQ